MIIILADCHAITVASGSNSVMIDWNCLGGVSAKVICIAYIIDRQGNLNDSK